MDAPLSDTDREALDFAVSRAMWALRPELYRTYPASTTFDDTHLRRLVLSRVKEWVDYLAEGRSEDAIKDVFAGVSADEQKSTEAAREVKPGVISVIRSASSLEEGIAKVRDYIQTHIQAIDAMRAMGGGAQSGTPQR